MHCDMELGTFRDLLGMLSVAMLLVLVITTLLQQLGWVRRERRLPWQEHCQALASQRERQVIPHLSEGLVRLADRIQPDTIRCDDCQMGLFHRFLRHLRLRFLDQGDRGARNIIQLVGWVRGFLRELRRLFLIRC